jgi:adenylosuccinate lyase
MSNASIRAKRYRERTVETLGLADKAANESWRRFYAVVAEFYATLAQGEEDFAAKVDALQRRDLHV